MLYPYMLRPAEQRYITEEYVSSPPALLITDERGDVWTLGTSYARMSEAPGGEFAFNILRNGLDTGVYGSRIERQHGRIRVFTRHGWRHWSGTQFL